MSKHSAVVVEVEEGLASESVVTVDATLMFDKYIGLPYWAERNFLINISKEVHPKLGDQKKQQALLAALEKVGKTMADYNLAQIRAARPFYTINDVNPNVGDGEIIVPARHFLSFLNNASQTAPKAVPRISNKGLTFIGVKFVGIEGFMTGKTKGDSKLFSRFVKLEDSNQRTWSESAFIENFAARATLTVDEEIIKATDLRKLCEWGGKYVGLGSARPQGYGRFSVATWDVR